MIKKLIGPGFKLSNEQLAQRRRAKELSEGIASDLNDAEELLNSFSSESTARLGFLVGRLQTNFVELQNLTGLNSKQFISDRYDNVDVES